MVLVQRLLLVSSRVPRTSLDTQSLVSSDKVEERFLVLSTGRMFLPFLLHHFHKFSATVPGLHTHIVWTMKQEIVPLVG